MLDNLGVEILACQGSPPALQGRQQEFDISGSPLRMTAIARKYLVSQVIGEIKGKCAINVARTSEKMSR